MVADFMRRSTARRSRWCSFFNLFASGNSYRSAHSSQYAQDGPAINALCGTRKAMQPICLSHLLRLSVVGQTCAVLCAARRYHSRRKPPSRCAPGPYSGTVRLYQCDGMNQIDEPYSTAGRKGSDRSISRSICSMIDPYEAP